MIDDVRSDYYLSEMVDGFITAAIWADYDPGPSDDDDGDGPELGADGTDAVIIAAGMDPASKLAAMNYCREFRDANVYALTRAAVMNRKGNRSGYNDGELAGHDLYLTAVGHGCGFWDRGYGVIGDVLSANVRDMVGIGGPYAGDDGVTYFDLPREYAATT